MVLNGTTAVMLVLLLLAADAHASEWVLFEWEPIRGATGYQLQIAKDSTLEYRVVDERVGASMFRWKAPDANPYYWRVRAIAPNGRPGAWSKIRIHRSAEQDKSPPAAAPTPKRPRVAAPAPRLLEPVDGILVPLGTRQVMLKWSSAVASTRWQVEIRLGKKILLKRSVDTNAMSFAPADSGTYLWRVRAVDPSGQRGRWSARRSFSAHESEIVIREPADDVTFPSQGTSTPIHLKWDPITFAADYRVEVAVDGALVNVVLSEITPEPHYLARGLAPGAYWWKVSARRKEVAFDATSPIGRFAIASFPELPAPRQLTPAPNTELVLNDARHPSTLSWVAVSDADRYQIAVFRAGAEEPLAIESTSVTHAPVPVREEGEYAWRVRSVAAGVSGDWSPASSFRVRPAEANATLGEPSQETVAHPQWWLGAQVGLVGDGVLWSGLARVELSWAPGLLSEAFLVSARLGYYQYESVYASAAVPDLELQQIARVIPLTIGAAYRWQLADFELAAGAGPSVHVVHLLVGSAARWGVRIGGEVYGSVHYSLGPGALSAGVSGFLTGIDNALLEVPVGSMTLSGGYKVAW